MFSCLFPRLDDPLRPLCDMVRRFVLVECPAEYAKTMVLKRIVLKLMVLKLMVPKLISPQIMRLVKWSLVGMA